MPDTRLLAIAGDPRAVEDILAALTARQIPMRDCANIGGELDLLRQREAIRAVLQSVSDLFPNVSIEEQSK